MRISLPILIIFLILLTGCSQGNGDDFSKMSNPEIVSYVMSHGEIQSDGVSNAIVNKINIDKERLDKMLISSPECKGLLTVGNYIWADIATESAHIDAFISLDENKVKCVYTRTLFSPKRDK